MHDVYWITSKSWDDRGSRKQNEDVLVLSNKDKRKEEMMMSTSWDRDVKRRM